MSSDHFEKGDEVRTAVRDPTQPNIVAREEKGCFRRRMAAAVADDAGVPVMPLKRPCGRAPATAQSIGLELFLIGDALRGAPCLEEIEQYGD
jgi:hypothetical protein